MSAHLQLVLRLVLLLAAIGQAQAHLGFENETEVRIHADRMRVVVRTSFKFAAALLGTRAPASFDEEGRNVSQPLLTEAAGGLFEVKAAGTAMKPTSANCIFEPHDKVAFVLTYARPEAWPLTFTARFFPCLAPLESGSIQIFDQRDKPFGREIVPMASKRITGDDPTLSLASLDGGHLPEAQQESPAPAAAIEQQQSPSRHESWLMAVVLVLAAGLTCVILRFRRPAQGG